MKNEKAQFQRQVEFLKFSLQDVQETIRATDQKSGTIVAIVAIVMTLIGADLSGRLLDGEPVPYLGVLILGIFALGVALSLSIMVLFPASEPANHVVVGESGIPRLPFFLGTLVEDKGTNTPLREQPVPGFWSVLRASNAVQLGYQHSEYLKLVRSATEEDITNSLSFEVLKTSFIRNRKLYLTRYALRAATAGLVVLGFWMAMLLL